MSASEKLKGLEPLTVKNEHGITIRQWTVGAQLAEALPQIVAVVEAAEATSKHQHLSDEHVAIPLIYLTPAESARAQADRIDESDRRKKALRAALSALEEALS